MTGEPVVPPRLVEHVAELRKHLGTRREVHRELEAHGLALSTAAVPEGGLVRFDGVLESISDGVVVTGEVTVPWEGECRRCLREVSGEATADVREIFETRPTEGETWPLEGDHLDLGPMVHDMVLLALPLAPLCAEDCAGPDPEHFPTSVEDDAPPAEGVEDEPPRDPRWAALDDLDLG